MPSPIGKEPATMASLQAISNWDDEADVPIHFAQPGQMIFDESAHKIMRLGTNFMP